MRARRISVLPVCMISHSPIKETENHPLSYLEFLQIKNHWSLWSYFQFFSSFLSLDKNRCSQLKSGLLKSLTRTFKNVIMKSADVQ